jgi:hypothetical protein
MQEIVRPASVPPGWRGPSLAPDQRLITGAPAVVRAQVARGRRSGAFRCQEISVYDGLGFAYAVVTLTPRRTNWPMLATLLGGGWAAVALVVWVAWSIGLSGLIAIGTLCAVGLFILATAPRRETGVHVNVDVKVER